MSCEDALQCLAARNPRTGSASVVDVATYRGIAFTKREPPINHEKLDVMTESIWFDSSKAQGVGYAPQVSYENGIARTLGGSA